MVLQSLLRQHASWKYQGYLLLRRNVFHWDFAHLVEPGGNPGGCRGYRCSFRPTQKGISLIMDISTTYKYPRQSSTRNIEPLRKSLVEECILEPEERLTMLTKANDANDYNSDPFFSGYKMKVDKQLMTLNGRILHPPEVASSREWPLISKYKVSLRTRAKSEMIENLYNPMPQGGDSRIINELLKDFCRTCKSPAIIDIKPKQVIIFRNGVSQSQFDRVLNVELQDVLKACNDFEHGYKPKVTFIVVQKSGHTKLFHNTAGNVQPGTIVDTDICHPRNFDFYLCPQAAMYAQPLSCLT